MRFQKRRVIRKVYDKDNKQDNEKFEEEYLRKLKKNWRKWKLVSSPEKS